MEAIVWSRDPIGSPATPIYSSFCDYFIAGFTLWTIVANVTVLAGGSLFHLISSFLSINLLLVGWLWLRKKRTRRLSREKVRAKQDQSEARQTRLFWVVVLMAVCFTLVAHRPDADDAFYVNLAVAAVDEPNAALLQKDTMHSSSKAAILLPVYKTHSLELMAAAISLLTHIPVIYIFHILFPPLAAALTVFAYGRLFRVISSPHWSWGVLAVVLFLFANGDTHASFGNMAFVRLHQGKGIFVTAMIPLLITYGIAFARYPSVRSWAVLCGAQVTSLGMSATALWVAPLVATLAVFAGMPPMNMTNEVKRLLLSCATSIYVVGFGLLMKFYYQIPESVVSGGRTPIRAIGYSTRYVFGFGVFGVACALIIVAAWLLTRDRLSRRLYFIFSLFVALSFMNPLLVDFLTRNLTGVQTYWRFFWVLPVPTLIGVAFVTILSSSKLALNLSQRKLMYSLTLVVLCGLLPTQYTFSTTNHTRIGFPSLKVPTEYGVAKGLSELLVDRETVLVPEEISVWLTTFHKHPYPLLSRTQYGTALYSKELSQAVLALKAYVTGSQRPDDAVAFFRETLERFRIQGACFSLSNPWAAELRAVLDDIGFEKVFGFPSSSYEVWIGPNREAVQVRPRQVRLEAPSDNALQLVAVKESNVA